MAINWTQPQRDAIFARGGGLLVSAAAGSGKTAVLVERVIQLICDPENPTTADRLLVVTFSNAAAAEMKQRIGARLSAMISENPSNLYLQRQQAALSGAQISTVHSFCIELIRQNFQNLEISSDFALLDENELRLLKQESVERCIEKFYADDRDGSFAALVGLISSGKDDRRLPRTVLKIYDFCRSHPWPEQWLDQTLERYDAGLPVADTIWGGSILALAAEGLDYCEKITLDALAELAEDPELERAYAAAFSSDLQALREVAEQVGRADWDGALYALRDFSFERLGTFRGASPRKARVQARREMVKKTVKDLTHGYFCATQAQFADDISDLRPKIETLFSLVKAFGRSLDATKAEKRRLDFSDLEHLALRLLVRRDADGVLRPTPQALELSQRYDWVLVDEYQDTNEVQDLIFTCVSRRQTNLFMVGDVKQSIYSFRQAMPEIFLKKRGSFFPYDGRSYPAKISLDTNFRSRPEVTGAVNYLFGRLMSARVGEVEYGEGERLVAGGSHPENGADNRPELLLITADEQDERDAVRREAAAVANRIAELIESGHPVSDKGTPRPVTPRDICVLLRAPKGRAEIYVQELQRRGVSAWAEKTDGFLAAREVSAIVCLLKALDNPLLDIELAAALMSPYFAFTDDEIAEIRLADRTAPLFLALRRSAENPKVRDFLQIFEQLRLLAASENAAELLLRIYAQTDALALVRAMPMGEGRAANLLLLLEYAAKYHAVGYKGLGGFVAFLSRLQERGDDLGAANTMGDGANVVRVLSVHRSKGLEFPVVVLADTARGFNLGDLHAPALLHSRFGFACVRRNPASMTQFVTPPLAAIRLESRASMLSEELRILYVALTRAREKLIISVAPRGSAEKNLARLETRLADGKLPAFMTSQAGSSADWILMALLHHPGGAPLRELGGSAIEALPDQTPWSVRVIQSVERREVSDPAFRRTASPDPDTLRKISERAAWRYPFAAQVSIPAKLAVSAVAKGQKADQARFAARPRFMAEQALTPAERGNAMHKFMQFADYARARSDLEGEISRMRSEQFLTAAEAESLSRGRLNAFFRSELADRIFAAQAVYRELKFMAEFGEELLGELLEGIDAESRVVLQGVADCVLVEDGGAVIVDYKTDWVSDPAELVDRYGTQLALYREILSESLGMPVRECIIYSFALSRGIPV